MTLSPLPALRCDVAVNAEWGLAEVVPEGVAFLIVGAAYGIVALALLALGRQRLKAVKPVPEQTVETLKEDAAWASKATCSINSRSSANRSGRPRSAPIASFHRRSRRSTTSW